jgi:hypothetical protein
MITPIWYSTILLLIFGNFFSFDIELVMFLKRHLYISVAGVLLLMAFTSFFIKKSIVYEKSVNILFFLAGLTVLLISGKQSYYLFCLYSTILLTVLSGILFYTFSSCCTDTLSGLFSGQLAGLLTGFMMFFSENIFWLITGFFLFAAIFLYLVVVKFELNPLKILWSFVFGLFSAIISFGIMSNFLLRFYR